ncbi:MAG: response regulator, partial [Bacillota bacterium]
NNHNGYINVESEVGVGTTFYIYLPAVTGEIILETPADKICSPGDGRILIMEDEEVIRNAAGEMLHEIGYQVTYAGDGIEAIQLYLQAKKNGAPFDAVIIDLTVPGGLGGKDTVQELLKHDPGVKSIVSSGYSNDPIMANYKEYGFCGMVVKPYKIEELSKVLQSVIRRNQSPA